MALADRANQYLAELAPWSLAKQEGTEQQVAAIYSQAINLFRVLVTYLHPVLPVLADNSREFLGLQRLDWTDLQTPLVSHRINKFKPLMQRVDPEAVVQMVADTRD